MKKNKIIKLKLLGLFIFLITVQSAVALGDTDKNNIDKVIYENINMIVEDKILDKEYESVIISNEDKYGQSLVHLEVDISILFSVSLDLVYLVEHIYDFGYFMENDQIQCAIEYLYDSSPSSANDIDAPFIPPITAPITNGLVVSQNCILDYSIEFENKVSEEDEVKIQFTSTTADIELLKGYEENGKFVYDFVANINADVTSVIYLDGRADPVAIPVAPIVIISFGVAVFIIFLSVRKKKR